jgi:hypothetical protein
MQHGSLLYIHVVIFVSATSSSLVLAGVALGIAWFHDGQIYGESMVDSRIHWTDLLGIIDQLMRQSSFTEV